MMASPRFCQITEYHLTRTQRTLIGILSIANVTLMCSCHKYSLVQPTVPKILEKREYSEAEYLADLNSYYQEMAGRNDQENLRRLRDSIVF